ATGSAFPTLKLKPRLGRLLNWQDDEPDASSNGIAAVISEAFWIEHFGGDPRVLGDRKSTRLNSSHVAISYAVFCLKKKKRTKILVVFVPANALLLVKQRT